MPATRSSIRVELRSPRLTTGTLRSSVIRRPQRSNGTLGKQRSILAATSSTSGFMTGSSPTTTGGAVTPPRVGARSPSLDVATWKSQCLAILIGGNPETRLVLAPRRADASSVVGRWRCHYGEVRAARLLEQGRSWRDATQFGRLGAGSASLARFRSAL
jgi:hypothetical protein